MGKSYCLFSANFLPNIGGVERYTYHLAKKLIEYGNQVFVVTSNTDHLLNQEIYDGISVFRMPCYNLLNGRFPVLKYNQECRYLLKTLKELKMDIIVVNTRFYIHSYFGVRFARRQGIAPIVIEHGTNHFTVNNAVLDFFGHIYEHLITGLIRQNCSSFYGVSSNCNIWLKHFRIHPKGTLYNAVDVPEIKHLSENPVENYRKALDISSSDFVVVYIGRLVREKGILKLLDATEKLNKLGKNIKLLIAGSGPLEDIIDKRASSTIFPLGKMDFAHVISLLEQADAFCLPTDYPEGFPTSVLEAAACKCFVITTDAGGSSELIIDKEHGIILYENTPEKIAEGLCVAMENQKYRKEAEERAYQRLTSFFTWEKTAKGLMLIGEQGDTEIHENN